MSTSQSRRERREQARLRNLPAHKLVERIRKVYPQFKLKAADVKGEQTYGEWLKEVEISPEMLQELQEHEDKTQLANKKTWHSGFTFEEVKY